MTEIETYNNQQEQTQKNICLVLQSQITSGLLHAKSKVWHGHPVWFLDGNPIAGYSVEKAGVRLMFWSGRSFDEPELIGDSKFKDASIYYNEIDEIDTQKVASWLKKATSIQWDYKNIVKRKGELEKLGNW